MADLRGPTQSFRLRPNLEEVARLAAAETLPGIKYVPAFVGVPLDNKDAERFQQRNFWARNPWPRLSIARTLELRALEMTSADTDERTQLNLWTQVPLADPAKPLILQDFLRKREINDIDFIKIDVDGADFLILRSLASTLGRTNTLGVGIEVNFFGSGEAEVHTFHNVDRLMREIGFDLFSLSIRTYSAAALPAPYLSSVPAQTLWGRPLQGDAIYFRDAAAPENAEWAETIGGHKLGKLAALFSLANLPDSAAEILQRFRCSIADVLDVEAGLRSLLAQCVPHGEPVPTYDEYISDFEADSDRFYPARKVKSKR
jgi:hypothetical protein